MLLLDSIFKLPRPIKRLITLSLDAMFIFLAYWGAWIIRIDSSDIFFKTDNWIIFLVVLPVTILTFIKLGLYRAVLRYMGTRVILSILIGTSTSIFTLIFLGFFTGFELPRTVPLLYAAFMLVFVGGSRFAVRTSLMQVNKRNKEGVVVYGAGTAGRQLAYSLMHGNEFDPIAFIDDDKNLHKTYVLGRPVYPFNQLEQLSKDVSIKLVLLAMPQIAQVKRSQILAKLEPLALEVKSIPIMSDIINGEAKIDELRDVAIDDLLGRDSVKPNETLMSSNISNKVVLVTGSGGSIGSELCRQIVLFKPKILILFEISEYALYSINSELIKIVNKAESEIEIVPIIGSVQNEQRLEMILDTFSVHTIYHAAAYKHVPLVEYNIIEGVYNNVFGTYSTAKAASKAGVEMFVLVSTDKAVRPTNIMGTTKRLAELSLQALARESNKTTFCMVRFGNVLGSSGSVVPLFREQIKKGGPITVTHKDITRFFMTIPEASQLVIQAGGMAKGGDVFVLDMGEPVKIYDLAVKMIHLMGLEVKDVDNPDGDIELQFSGLRPGEKLFEELLIGNNVYATDHLRIMTANESYLELDQMEFLLKKLGKACDDFDIKLVQQILQDAPTGYNPNSRLCDLVWSKKNSNLAKVTSLR